MVIGMIDSGVHGKVSGAAQMLLSNSCFGIIALFTSKTFYFFAR